MQGKCLPEESFSTVGSEEGPRGAMEGKVGELGLHYLKEWREVMGHFEEKQAGLGD